MTKRQVILDTETTGLNPQDGHRIIEIGCLEMVNRKLTGQQFHYYLQPDMEIEAGAIAVHGITNEFLKDKPRFADIVDEFKAFIEGAELIIHNAPFDIGFINAELVRHQDAWASVEAHTTVLDTLPMARKKHPGQRNTLDALVKRYQIGERDRTYHGALLDSEILADVYLAMTGGQIDITFGEPTDTRRTSHTTPEGQSSERSVDLAERKAVVSGQWQLSELSEAEQSAHDSYCETLEKSAGHCLFTKTTTH